MRNPLSKKVETIQPSGIRKFFDIVSEMEDVISLGVGEPDFDTPEAVKQAVASILNVCGFVLCFSVMVGLLDAKGLFSLACGFLSSLLGWELHFSRALLTGVLELGSAAGAMAGLDLTPHNLALAAGVLGWGGLSVHFQTLAVLAGSKIKGALHLTGRLISASIAAVTAYIIGVILF